MARRVRKAGGHDLGHKLLFPTSPHECHASSWVFRRSSSARWPDGQRGGVGRTPAAVEKRSGHLRPRAWTDGYGLLSDVGPMVCWRPPRGGERKLAHTSVGSLVPDVGPAHRRTRAKQNGIVCGLTGPSSGPRCWEDPGRKSCVDNGPLTVSPPGPRPWEDPGRLVRTTWNSSTAHWGIDGAGAE